MKRRCRWPALLTRLGVPIGIIFWLLIPGVAQAHAHLVQADPVPWSVTARAPAVAMFWFNAPLDPALTSVRILDAGGQQVAGDGGYIAPGSLDRLWLLPLPALRDGTYTVQWTSESALDGHIMSSTYTFRVGPPGGASARPVGSGTVLGLDPWALGTALWHWLGLLSQALWLGALIVDMVVLVPRRRAGDTPEAALSRAAEPRLWWLIRLAIAATLIALGGEVLSLAMQGTRGDWARAIAPATLRGILSSPYGHYVLARAAVLCLALLFAAGGPSVASGDRPATAYRPAGGRRRWLASPRLPSPRALLALLAADELLLVAFSGHAAEVNPNWLSYPIDWAHLLCTAAWAGGIAALAFGVVPCGRALPPGRRAAALLALLGRYSPVAYASIGVLALSGAFNALSHVESPSVLTGSAYGNLLLVKLALVALLMGLSAIHVLGLRPRMSRLLAGRTPAAAGVGRPLALLAMLLRVEAGVGAAILLVTALMGQTLPSDGPLADAGGASSAPSPPSIAGTAVVGAWRADLTITPPQVGPATFAVRLWERDRPLAQGDGTALIRLVSASRPSLRADLATQGHGTVFTAGGTLGVAGIWRAELLVRAVAANATVPFTFTVGPGAAFLAPEPAVAATRGSPGAAGGALARALPYVALVTEPGTGGVQTLGGTLLRTGPGPYGVAVPAGSRDAYVTYFAGARGTVARIDLRDGRLVRTYAVGVGPARIAFTPDRRRAFVTNFRSSDLSAIDLATGVSHRIVFPDNYCFEPFGVDVSEDGQTAYVACAGGSYIYTVATGTLRPGRPIATGKGATGVAVDPPRHEVWVANAGARSVTVLDERTLHTLAVIPAGLYPVAVRPAPDGRVVYALDQGGDALLAIDAARRRVVARVPVAAQPSGLAVTADGRYVYVASARGRAVTIVRTSDDRIIAVVPLGDDPDDLAIAG